MSKENGDQLMLKRSFGMREAVTITVGTVIGVGLFTTGAQIVGLMGSAVVLATFIAMVISVYPARLYIACGDAFCRGRRPHGPGIQTLEEDRGSRLRHRGTVVRDPIDRLKKWRMHKA